MSLGRTGPRGWSRRLALVYNVAAALTVLIGSSVAYVLAGTVDATVLVPLAAGNFIYIAAADLLPS